MASIRKHMIIARKNENEEEMKHFLKSRFGMVAEIAICNKCSAIPHWHAAVVVEYDLRPADYKRIRSEWSNEIIKTNECRDCIKAIAINRMCKEHSTYFAIINIKTAEHWHNVVEYINDKCNIAWETFQSRIRQRKHYASKKRKLADGDVHIPLDQNYVESRNTEYKRLIVKVRNIINSKNMISREQFNEEMRINEELNSILFDPIVAADPRRFYNTCEHFFDINREMMDSSFLNSARRWHFDNDNRFHKLADVAFRMLIATLLHYTGTTNLVDNYEKTNEEINKHIYKMIKILSLEHDKQTTLVLFGRSNSGKTLLSSVLSSVFSKYEIGTCTLNSSVNERFWAQDLIGKFCYRIEEARVSSKGTCDIMKLLFEGNTMLRGERKYKESQDIERRPTIVTFNGQNYSDLFDHSEYYVDLEPFVNRTLIYKMNEDINKVIEPRMLTILGDYGKYVISKYCCLYENMKKEEADCDDLDAKYLNDYVKDEVEYRHSYNDISRDDINVENENECNETVDIDDEI